MAARASIGIISIGEMGLGVANLLASQNYRVVTNVAGRRYEHSFWKKYRFTQKLTIAAK
jgi:predicted dinucleotide-binding enzyme